MSKLQKNANLINSIIVDGVERSSFLPNMVGEYYSAFEKTVYWYASQFCNEYNGGFWEFIKLDNNSFYIRPTGVESYQMVVSSNYFKGSLTADATGIVVSLYALCLLANKTHNENLINRYHSLREYALSHPEAKEILGAID